MVLLTALLAGLDVTHYKGATAEVAEREFKTLQSQITDKERFAESEPLYIRCRYCHLAVIFDGVAENAVCACRWRPCGPR